MAGGNGTGVTPALVLRLTGGSLRVSRVSLGCCRPQKGGEGSPAEDRTALRELKRVGPKPTFARRMHCMCAAAAGSAHNARIARPCGTFSFECAERSNRGFVCYSHGCVSQCATEDLQLLCVNCLFDAAARLHVVLPWA